MCIRDRYEKDGLPFAKVVANIIRQKFICPAVRPVSYTHLFTSVSGSIVQSGGSAIMFVIIGTALDKIGFNTFAITVFENKEYDKYHPL